MPLTPEEVLEKLQTYNAEFDDMIQQRWELGAEKYGPLKFLQTDTMQEALFELADLSNYARATFMRIRLLMESGALEDPNGQ